MQRGYAVTPAGLRERAQLDAMARVLHGFAAEQSVDAPHALPPTA